MANFGLGHYITYHTVVLDLLTQKNVNIYDFIIANSTFSLIAAYFGKNSESIVTYPDPWFQQISLRQPRDPKQL